MAFSLAYTVDDHNDGYSLLVEDASTDWPSMSKVVTSIEITLESLYSGVTLAPITITINPADPGKAFVQGFQYELTSTQIFGSAILIPDSNYKMEMVLFDAGGEIVDAGYNYDSEEIYYYNLLNIRDNFIAEKASYIDDVYNKDMDYANWLDFLVLTVESNTFYGSTSAIYYVFDIEERLNS